MKPFDEIDFSTFCERVLGFTPLPEQVELTKAAYEGRMIAFGRAPGRATARFCYEAWEAVHKANEHLNKAIIQQIMKPFKPMLAGKCPGDLAELNYPVLASPKLDGIRCIIIDGVAMSRSLKPIPNEFVQDELAGLPDGLDGELMIGGGFNAVTSGIMSVKGRPDFTFHVFDCTPGADSGMDDPQFHLRLYLAEGLAGPHPRVETVKHTEVFSVAELRQVDSINLRKGYEGTMVRDPAGTYKCGRSTTKEGGLLKLKYFEDEEAALVGMVEQYHNANEAKVNALGRTERSTHKANKVPIGTMGALICRTSDGAEFNVGTGFTAVQRQQIWDDMNAGKLMLESTTVKFRYQPDPGGRKPGQAPRIPSFLGFRHEDDLS